MSLSAAHLEAIFASCFRDSHRTLLVGGAPEPLYQPSTETGSYHLIHYRADYASSALHEVAHWCIAGKRRRTLADYGYWYAPDGRTEAQQSQFERVEVAPQALESLFAEAAGIAFHLSADNLGAGAGPSAAFAEAVARRRRFLRLGGLSGRARRFHEALRRHRGDMCVDKRPIT